MKSILYYVFCFACIFEGVNSYNMNNFPIIKRLFDKRNQNNYSKKAYNKFFVNNSALNKLILDDMAANIVGPNKNNTRICNKY